MTTTSTKGKGRGFAGMDEETKRRIARLGGKAAHAQGVAHKWNPETAAKAGKIGGSRSRRTGVGNKPKPEE